MFPTAIDIDADEFVKSGAVPERTAGIALWGSALRIRIKAHFDHEIAAHWASNTLERPLSELNDDIVNEFMTEFVNRVGHYLRGAFESVSIVVGASPPRIFLGQGRLVDKEDVGLYAWRLTDGEREVIATAEVELFNPQAVAAAETRLLEALKNSQSHRA